MDTSRQRRQLVLVDLELLRDRQHERRLAMLAQSGQVLLHAGAPPEAEHFEIDRLAGLLLDPPVIRHPEAVAQRQDVSFLANLPALDLLLEELDEQRQLGWHE